MHLPDGFLAPQTWIPATALSLAALTWAVAHCRRLALADDCLPLPRMAVLTALCYALGLVMLPLPGGVSGHLLGVALLALLFGVAPAFVAYALVLVLQALLFAAGGVTSWGVNLLLIGGIGAVSARGLFLSLRQFLQGVLRWRQARAESVAVWLASYVSMQLSALALALILGAQAQWAVDPQGKPLFFPLSWHITLPAVLLPHLLIGLVEASLTLVVWRWARRKAWSLP